MAPGVVIFSVDVKIAQPDQAGAGPEVVRQLSEHGVGHEGGVELRVAGRHQAENLLAAATAAAALGLSAEQIADAARDLQAAPHRGRVYRLAGGAVLVDDSYNASPVAVARMLELLAAVEGRRIAVLGEMLARLVLPALDPIVDFDFVKAYYARFSDRLHGRVTRLFVSPLLAAFARLIGQDPYIRYLASFRYPLSGEFAVQRDLVSRMRLPSDWGLEIVTLFEALRHRAPVRICQVEIADRYEHKHQGLSAEDLPHVFDRFWRADRSRSRGVF